MQCRTCLEINLDGFVDMKTACLNGVNIYDCFNDCTNLTAHAEDGLPSMLCLNCTRELEISYNFIQGAREMDATLRAVLAETGSVGPHILKIAVTEDPAALETLSADESELEQAIVLDPSCAVEYIEDKSIKEKSFVAMDDELETIFAQETNYIKIEEPEIERDLTSAVLNSKAEQIESDTEEIQEQEITYVKNETEPLTDHVEQIEDIGDFSNNITFPDTESESESEMQNVCNKNHPLFQHVDQSSDAISDDAKEMPESEDENYDESNFIGDADEIRNKRRRDADTIKCQFCHNDFPFKWDLMKHFIEEHEAEVTCNRCPKNFNFPEELELHNELVHGKDTPVQCTYCPDLQPIPRVDLAKHFRTKHTHRYIKFFPSAKRNQEEKYQCYICLRYCVTATLYADHMQAHSDIKMFKCKFCPKDFQLRRTFQAHLKLKHNATGNVTAYIRDSETNDICDENYASDSQENMDRNAIIEEHEYQNEFEASIENSSIIEECETDEEFIETMDQSDNQYDDGDGEGDAVEMRNKDRYKTSGIVKKYRQRAKLDDGTNVNERKTYACSLCPNTFVRYQSLQLHLERVHPEYGADKKDWIECTQCKRLFSSEQYDVHMQWHQRKNKKTFLCSFCPRLFINQTYLTLHENKIHLKKETKKQQCPICEKDVDVNYFKAHMKKIHANERKFVCQVCGNTFKIQGALDKHMKLHNAREFECSVCHKGFTTRCDLKVHIRTHTGELPYECHLCDKRFAMKGRLTYHLQRHAGIKHQCKECGKEFNVLSLLKKHSFTHTGMPYHCPSCGYQCALRQVFTRHLLRMHGIVLTEAELLAMFKKNTGRLPRILPTEELHKNGLIE